MHRRCVNSQVQSQINRFIALAARRRMSWTCHGRSNADMVDKLRAASLLKSEIATQALKAVDRAFFCPDKQAAYIDAPQQIGFNATISAPHMHATCLELLQDNLQPGNRALDVGSGSGYLTVVIAKLVGRSGKAVGIEHIPQLTESAQAAAENIPFAKEAIADGSLRFMTGNGMQGWAEDGPYNAIHVGASAAEIPSALLDQLAPGGRLVLPVGAPGDKQSLKVIDRDDKDGFYSKDMMGVQYVPLTSKEVQLRGGLLSGSVVVNS